MAAWRDGRFVERPVRALRAFARVYAGWAMSQAFYRERLWERVGFTSLEDYLVRAWEGNFLRRHGEDLFVDDRYLVSIRAVEQFDDRVPKRD